MCKTPIAYLLHILEECNYILSVVTDDLPMYQFLSDETLKRAVCRSLEIVGEVTKKIPADVKYQWSDIQWKHMAGMRDRLIHNCSTPIRAPHSAGSFSVRFFRPRGWPHQPDAATRSLMPASPSEKLRQLVSRNYQHR